VISACYRISCLGQEKQLTVLGNFVSVGGEHHSRGLPEITEKQPERPIPCCACLARISFPNAKTHDPEWTPIEAMILTAADWARSPRVAPPRSLGVRENL
jgi:hypothetical protein